MEPHEWDAYDAFLHSGKVADYLNYIDARQPVQGGQSVGATQTTGENSAYYDRRDRAAGTRG